MDDPEQELDALERILVDANAEPIALSYASLCKITNGFSQEIGRGGFGLVYMGVLQNGRVAVKKLSKIHEFSERQFEDELICLIKVKHKNIVRFLGYCSDTSRQVVKHNGTYILAEVRRRFLCFEYVPNKSLKEYLKDESYGRDWDTRYQLIAGICHGLRYLHNEERIIHLDLKPENILLDIDMVPKITDFGLSRRFGTEQSRVITKEIKGTRGYIAPEYHNNGEISFKSDMYSLGIIIKKLIRGSNDLSDFENWHTSLVLDNQQVKRIIEMAQLCVSADQHIRPTIDEFIDMVNEKETMTTVVSPVYGHSRSNSGSSLEQMEEHNVFPPVVSKERLNKEGYGEEVVHKMEAPNKEVTLDMQGKEELLVPNTGVGNGFRACLAQLKLVVKPAGD